MSSAELKKLYIEQCGVLGKNAENPVNAVIEMLNNVSGPSGAELSKKIAKTITPSVWKLNTVSFVVLVYDGLIGSRSVHGNYIKNILTQLEAGIPRAYEIFRFLAYIIARDGKYFTNTCNLDFVEVTPIERTYIASELFTECNKIVDTSTRKFVFDKITEYVGDINKTTNVYTSLIAENKVITAKCSKLVDDNGKLTAENEKLVAENEKLVAENKKLAVENKSYYEAVCKTNDNLNKLDDTMRERDTEVSKLNAEIRELNEKISDLTSVSNEKSRVADACLVGLAAQGNEFEALRKKYNELHAEMEKQENRDTKIAELKKKYEELEASSKKTTEEFEAKISDLNKTNKNFEHKLTNAYMLLKKHQNALDITLKDIDDGTVTTVAHYNPHMRYYISHN